MYAQSMAAAPPQQQLQMQEDYGPAQSVVPLTQELLEAVLGFRVVDFSKYVRVFMHKSASRETGVASYERLEFIGDAVLNFVVAKYLYDQHPNADEGFLTRIRTKLVCSKMLSAIAWRLGLQNYVVMNAKAIRQNWQSNPRILEDVLESLIGCVYLDLGLLTAKSFIIALFERFVDFHDILIDTNYKDIAMRSQQARGLPLPDYVVLNDPQITRRPMFVVRVEIQGVAGTGSATSKKEAEQRAAHHALAQLDQLAGQFVGAPPPPQR